MVNVTAKPDFAFQRVFKHTCIWHTLCVLAPTSYNVCWNPILALHRICAL